MIEIEKIRLIIEQGEGLTVEFKKSHESLSRDVFETICAFLNRKGGHILLGVKDKGYIEGVKEDSISKQLETLDRDMNNSQIIMPTTCLNTEIVPIDGKKIIYIYVPESSEPHTHKGIYFDRIGANDFELKTRRMITDLYIRKNDKHTEDRIYPSIQMDDFDVELFDMVRQLVSVKTNGKHLWCKMNNEEILRSARMYLHDERTGEDGYTLAAVLVFGKEATIASVCPHYWIDAICRKEDVERYDDRNIVDCNLIKAYDRLLNFVRKHTPDRFFLEGTMRISIRDIIFREMIANLLIHREYSSHYRASLIIYKDTVVTENWNIPHTMGRITPENLKPYSKNPAIADFFRELGWVEELGSGVRKLFRYCPLYIKDKKALPVMDEEDIFKLTIRYEKTGQIKTNDSEQLKQVSNTEMVLTFIRENNKITAYELMSLLSLSERGVRKILASLQDEGKLQRKGSRKEGFWVIVSKDEQDKSA
jgi:ATP-dependent DNA helicase RecG